MSLAANSSIELDIHTPKKDATVNNGTGAPTVGADEIAIFAGASVPIDGFQQNIGDFIKLHRYAQSHMVSLSGSPCTVHISSGGSDRDIEINGTPGVGDLVLYIGANVHGNEQSHFLDRTFKRLVERWLEETKDNA